MGSSASETKEVASPSERLIVHPLTPCALGNSIAKWSTQVMSRQEKQPESRLVCQQPKQAREHDTDAHQRLIESMPWSIVASGAPLNMLPFIRGCQDNMTNWMSSLINQLDGCLRMVAQRAGFGRQRQKQIVQTVAMCAPWTPSLDRDQVQYLRDHSSCTKKLLAHMRLLSSEAKDWKSRVVSEAEQVLVQESAKTEQRTNEVRGNMDKLFQTRWRETKKLNFRTCMSPTALKHSNSQPACR